jgi:alkaline phosphatase
LGCSAPSTLNADHIRDLQTTAARKKTADWGHWGSDPEQYSTWFAHSNRLIPIYTFGLKLDELRGAKSVYRDAQRLKKLYGYEPQGTLNPSAEYFDQTDVARLQQMAVDAGKKRVIVILFDGMDWQTTWAAAIYSSGKVAYREGRGTGLHFQDYRGVESDFGYFACSPANEGTNVNVDSQTLENPGGEQKGGYAWEIAGTTPWTNATILDYCIGKCKECSQAYTDSASSATSLFSGIKTFNDAVNVDPVGRQVEPIARKLQKRGFAIGVVTSVPISHATPAAAYANNVHRSDYQDLTRDLVGLPSIAHPNEPLPGVDVLLGAGWGESKNFDKEQGSNYVSGNSYITEADLRAIDVQRSETGKYCVAQRTTGRSGREVLLAATEDAANHGKRLLGLFGVKGGHLPYQTADGDYEPTFSIPTPAENYSKSDVYENPTLADFAAAALKVLSKNKKGFWLLIEAGDVDWANHANNIDNSIGAVLSGDAAFKTVCDWIESNGGWNDTAVIVTADHGHYFFLEKPETLVARPTPTTASK